MRAGNWIANSEGCWPSRRVAHFVDGLAVLGYNVRMKYGEALSLHRFAYGCGAEFMLVSPRELVRIMDTAVSGSFEEACCALDELWPSARGPAGQKKYAERVRLPGSDVDDDTTEPPVERSAPDGIDVVGVAYGQRNRNVALLGFKDYAEYLRSPLWFSIRARVLRERSQCDFCGCEATQVHHSSYSMDVLRGNTTVGLHATCRECHRGGEYDGRKKLSPGVATKKMRASGRRKKASALASD